MPTHGPEQAPGFAGRLKGVQQSWAGQKLILLTVVQVGQFTAGVKARESFFKAVEQALKVGQDLGVGERELPHR